MNIANSAAARSREFMPFSNFEREEVAAAREIYRRLPRQMLVTNSLSLGLHAEAKTTGVRNRYIQVNHPNLTKMMVFDVDNPIDLYDWKHLDIPLPNILVINPKNRHAHMIYLLSDSDYVCRSAKGRLRDILAYQAVYSEICRRLNADPRYVQKIMKNPFHNSWQTRVLHEDTYTFEDFYRQLDTVPGPDRTSSLGNASSPQSLLKQEEGRNCTVFEQTRFYAYAAIKNHDYCNTEEKAESFYNDILRYAATLNDGFQQPLGSREIQSTVKSIVSWTIRHFGTDASSPNSTKEKKFEKKDIWGDSSRRNSLKTRQNSKNSALKKAAMLRSQGKKIEEIAALLKKSRRTIEYYLAEYKKFINKEKEHPQTRKTINSIRQLLWQRLNVQFVISDIKGISQTMGMLLFFELIDRLE